MTELLPSPFPLLELFELFELFFDLLDFLPDGSSFDEHEGKVNGVGSEDTLGIKLGDEVTDGSVEMEGLEEGLEVLDGTAEGSPTVCAKVIFELAARERSMSAALLDGTMKGLIVF